MGVRRSSSSSSFSRAALGETVAGVVKQLVKDIVPFSPEQVQAIGQLIQRGKVRRHNQKLWWRCQDEQLADSRAMQEGATAAAGVRHSSSSSPFSRTR